LKNNWNITIAARRLEQAQELTRSFADHKLHITNFNDLVFSPFDLIVNTTPLGMSPDFDRSPLPENLSLPEHVAVYDLVYNPRETKLVRNARAQGLPATTGLGMLIEQAALAFKLWTGQDPSRDELWNAVENRLLEK